MVMLSSKASGFIVIMRFEFLVHCRGLMTAVKLTISPTWMLVHPLILGWEQFDKIFISTSLVLLEDIVTESTIF